MIFVDGQPSVPPFLHLGWVRLSRPVSAVVPAAAREIDSLWRQMATAITQDPQQLRPMSKRQTERDAEFRLSDEPFEVFYTITEAGRIPLDSIFTTEPTARGVPPLQTSLCSPRASPLRAASTQASSPMGFGCALAVRSRRRSAPAAGRSVRR